MASIIIATLLLVIMVAGTFERVRTDSVITGRLVDEPSSYLPDLLGGDHLRSGPLNDAHNIDLSYAKGGRPNGGSMMGQQTDDDNQGPDMDDEQDNGDNQQDDSGDQGMDSGSGSGGQQTDDSGSGGQQTDDSGSGGQQTDDSGSGGQQTDDSGSGEQDSGSGGMDSGSGYGGNGGGGGKGGSKPTKPSKGKPTKKPGNKPTRRGKQTTIDFRLPIEYRDT